ncbi:DUF4893 domain-containing protein [Nordella sp. HKS 07]|uniref:DUF4893 domain-containing protein n=1 Tax=Nordella sp. HKS 07 TaxID=2712222 RepID=UPI001FEEB909|nr:DUF4893 domain-containing protein [Nordella sp. HKS 07]
MSNPVTRTGLIVLALFASATAAGAEGKIDKLMTAGDKTRLAAFEKARAEAIAEAKNGGTPNDIATLDAILAGKPLSFSGSYDMTGTWQCRTVKLGGRPALTIYGWFKCRVTDDGSGWRLEKLTGSQRTSGAFYTESDTRLTYIGAFHYADEKPRHYGTDPDRDEVAYAIRAGDRRVRLEFPLPKYESKFDIIELKR